MLLCEATSLWRTPGAVHPPPVSMIVVEISLQRPLNEGSQFHLKCRACEGNIRGCCEFSWDIEARKLANNIEPSTEPRRPVEDQRAPSRASTRRGFCFGGPAATTWASQPHADCSARFVRCGSGSRLGHGLSPVWPDVGQAGRLPESRPRMLSVRTARTWLPRRGQ